MFNYVQFELKFFSGPWKVELKFWSTKNSCIQVLLKFYSGVRALRIELSLIVFKFFSSSTQGPENWVVSKLYSSSTQVLFKFYSSSTKVLLRALRRRPWRSWCARLPRPCQCRGRQRWRRWWSWTECWWISMDAFKMTGPRSLGPIIE